MKYILQFKETSQTKRLKICVKLEYKIYIQEKAWSVGCKVGI
jgi:hypothetical protein